MVGLEGNLDMKRIITWLHISDLHARLRSDWDSRQITESLVNDLKLLQKENAIRPDLLFFTGDIAFGSANGEKMVEQYQKARAVLDGIRGAFDPAIPVRDLYLVPGNHDIDRHEITPDQTSWLRSRDRNLTEIISAMQEGKKQWRSWIERLQNYRNFLTAYGLLHLRPDDPFLTWTDSRQIAGIRVGISGFNSAWSCADDKDKANLWCGGEWQIAQNKQQMGPVSFAFALIHHPGNWFTHHEDPSFMRHLRQEFPILLHGHEHREWIEADHEGRLIISAGACYDSSWMPNGYNVGQIDLESSEIKIWARQWDKDGKGWVPRNVAGKTKNGVFLIEKAAWLSGLGPKVEPVVPEALAAVSEGKDDSSVSAKSHFTRRFCENVIDQHDILELFGCDIPRDLQRHQLSVAYVSLNLSPEDEGEHLHKKEKIGDKKIDDEKLQNPNHDERDDVDLPSAAFESVLDDISEDSNRLMILGPAGAGKSTLLRWCAIHAANRILEGPSILTEVASINAHPEILKAWNRFKDLSPPTVPKSWRWKIPILIRLRDCTGGKIPAANELPRFLAKHLPTAPTNWLTGIMECGRAIIMFDGVDEVHRDQRPQLAEEIGEVVRTYPDCTYIVTTRPGAVEIGWLRRLNFTEARVEPMTRADREEFIVKWYNSAGLELKHRPRPGEDLTRTAERLKSELTDQPELGILASNPLLCAMICALYRERQEKLPETPSELCEALVQMLLHRRERETPGLQDTHFLAAWRPLQYPQKKALLADLAWHMVSHGDSSIDVDVARSIVSTALAATPGRSETETAEVLQALIERSGLLRPSGEDRIDFLHNTLKEYLAAGQAVDGGDWHALSEHADDPAWQPVILFTLALAPEQFSSSMVRELLKKAPSGNLRRVNLTRRQQALLAESKVRDFFLVRCRSVAKRLAPELSDQIDDRTSGLFPPNYMEEAEALAQLGPRIFLHGAACLLDSNWWFSHRGDVRLMARCLRLLRLIGGEKAGKAAALAQALPRWSSLLTGEWMIASSELCDAKLPWPFTLRDYVWANKTRVSDLRPLLPLSELKELLLSSTKVMDLAPLANLKALESLDLSDTRVGDLGPISNLVKLRRLRLQNTKVHDLRPLLKMRDLTELLLDFTDISEIDIIGRFRKLRRLDIDGTSVTDLTPLKNLKELRTLYLRMLSVEDIGPLNSLGALEHLYLNGCTNVADFSPLGEVSSLKHLGLGQTNIEDLSPLSKMSSLTWLNIQNTKVYDLDPICRIASLKHISLTQGLIGKESLAELRKRRPDIAVLV